MSNASWRLENAAVVLVANTHNPSIINPDFLKNNGIIPADCKVGQELLVTPILAKLAFQNVMLTVVPEQLHLEERNKNPENNRFLDSSMLYDCTKKYVTALPHIPYIALGLNWRIRIPMPAPDSWFKERFLKGGAWQEKIKPVNFVFKIQHDIATVYTLITEIQDGDVMISCNFHFNLENENRKIKRITETIDNWKMHKKTFETDLQKYFTQEELA
ncbi:hypothetical protein [Candidatus Spongiihabitans sp.]|uniref:hypothetical protein n=1 Tax=Candidatus Spongiihabitans sp. TaxID=3101308 RepID=UPI003C6F870E